MLPVEMGENISKVLLNACRNFPGRTAVLYYSGDSKDRQQDYQSLFQESSVVASRIIESQITPGEVVILMLDQLEQLIPAFFRRDTFGSCPIDHALPDRKT